MKKTNLIVASFLSIMMLSCNQVKEEAKKEVDNAVNRTN